MARKKAPSDPASPPLIKQHSESMTRLAEGVWPGQVLVIHGESDTFNGYMMLVADAADEDEMKVTLAHVPGKVGNEILAEIAAGQRRGIVETQEWQYHWALLLGGGPAGVMDLTLPRPRFKKTVDH